MGIKLKNKNIIVIAIIMMLLIIVLTSYYQVDQTEYAVIVTLGKPSTEIIKAGPHFKLPYPIQSVKKLSTETFSLTFGYTQKGQDVVTDNIETKMITGDENIILADMEVQWKIIDPIAFIYNTNNPQEILYNATSASLRNVIGNSTVDEALTDGRAKITSNITEDLRQIVEKYELGVHIVNVNLQDIDLPTYEVEEAFKEVTSARENRVTKINEGNQYRNKEINTVKGQQDTILSKAESEKVKIVEKSKADVASFNAIYSEYAKNPSITKQRLVIDTMNEVLKQSKVYIVNDDGSTVKYLPLDVIGGNK